MDVELAAFLADYDPDVADAVLSKLTREDADAAVRKFRRGGRAPVAPTRLDEFLAEPDDPQVFRLDKVLPMGSDVMVTAQYKSGKSTLVSNATRSLVDGDPFLGRYSSVPVTGSVVLIDNELSPGMHRRWLRDQGIVNTDHVQVVSLQGRVADFDVMDARVRTEWADMLRAVNAEVIVFDCLRPALDAFGLDENTQASRFVNALTALKVEAGASELVVVHHMGKTGNQARGDSGLQGWHTVEWKLTRANDNPSSPRSFSAYGRDVDVPEQRLEYDVEHRRLTLPIDPGQQWATRTAEQVAETTRENERRRYLIALRAYPGATSKVLERELAVSPKKVGELRNELMAEGLVKADRNAQNNWINPQLTEAGRALIDGA